MGEVVSRQSSVVGSVFSGDPQGSAFQLRISDWGLRISRLWADMRLRYANNESRECARSIRGVRARYAIGKVETAGG